ncbi:MAG: DUF2167 domain-containing protein [Kangiellaceae bacterium]|nr:DUF2167 domain-containing protein [Kangiellaceae bacterium]
MLKHLYLFLLLGLPLHLHAVESGQLSEDEKYAQWAKELWDSFDRQNGNITLSGAVASLDVPESFYFLDANDANKVLVDVWGNPPGTSILGMLFPEGMTPFDNGAWAVTIEYEEDGYVSDEDAADIDYSDLLSQMKDDTRSASRERVKQGYESIELVGWAASPYYDSVSHKLHWAKEIKFGEMETNTLNYNIRILGRRGVLVLNFIAGIEQKELIESQLDSVLAIAEFDRGSTYTDFNPDIDTVAAYGIGALVAGKVIAKTGLIAAAIIFLKKFGIFIIIGIGAFLKKILSRKKADGSE